VRQAALDLKLRFRPPAEIDRARFDRWARRVGVDARRSHHAAVAGDVATLEWIRDRIAHTLDTVSVTRIDTRLQQLRAGAGDGRLASAARTAKALRRVLAGAGPGV